MRTVLYTNDLEPITVLSLDTSIMDMLVERGIVRIAVIDPPEYVCRVNTGDSVQDTHCCVVNIYAEKLIWKGTIHYILITNDEVSALRLKCAFLPGQQQALNERDRDSFARGFVNAIHRIAGR